MANTVNDAGSHMRTPQQVVAQTLVDRLGPNVTLPRAIVENLAFDAIACVDALTAEGYKIVRADGDYEHVS